MKGPLPPQPLDGELRFDEATRDGCADDFGHIVHEIPEGVLLPRSADDIAKTIQWAVQRGTQLAPRGQSHSTFGRSQVADGIVADMSTLRSMGAIERDRVVVEAGAKWSEVLRATLAEGKTPPVLTEYLELSVGGTLAVGGVGATTSTFGVQSDNVIDLEVVTGTGEQITCSASEDADLFDAVRAGLGQTGVIIRATLELIAAPESLRRFQLFYPDLATMLGDARLLSADNRFDVLQGAIVPAARRHRLPARRGEDSHREHAGRRRSTHRPVGRSRPAAAGDDRLLRLPQPARSAGESSAGQRTVVSPASVARGVHR